MIEKFIKSEPRRYYADIFEGKFELIVNNERPDARQRVNKAGKTVYGIVVSTLCGRVSYVEYRENEYGVKLGVGLISDGDELFIRMPFDSAQASGFLNVLPNIDFSADVELIARPGDGRERAALFVKQHGVCIKHAFTRENPNGRPDWVRHEMGDGKIIWDKSAQTSFFKSLIDDINGTIADALKASPPAPASVPDIPAPRGHVAASLQMHAAAAEMAAPEHIASVHDDDLPF